MIGLRICQSFFLALLAYVCTHFYCETVLKPKQVTVPMFFKILTGISISGFFMTFGMTW